MDDRSRPVRYLVLTWVPAELLEEWNAWHNDHHIPDVLATGLFRGVRKYRLVDTSMPGEWQPQYVTEYTLDTMERLQAYLDGPAAALRQDYNEHYGAVGKVARMTLAEEQHWP